MIPTKKELLEAVMNNHAEYLHEHLCSRDTWIQVYTYKGLRFYVTAYGVHRAIEPNPDFIQFTEDF